jgi:hypothetical protein
MGECDSTGNGSGAHRIVWKSAWRSPSPLSVSASSDVRRDTLQVKGYQTVE